MNLKKLDLNEIRRLEQKVGNIETFKEKIKNAPAPQLDVYKDLDSINKNIYVCNKGGAEEEFTYETLY